MTELEVQPEASTLTGWALDAQQTHLVARSLASTSFVPKQFQGKPHEITAAILTGKELGLDPMTALRSIVVINGTPAITAVALRGLVQAAGHEVWVDESTNTRAVVSGRRHGDERVQQSDWSIDRAKQLGLAEKDNYRKQPKAMLIARATSELCRLIAADVLLGMPYSVEELIDDTPADEPKAKPRTGKARRAPIEPAPEPEPLEEPDLEPALELETEPAVAS